MRRAIDRWLTLIVVAALFVVVVTSLWVGPRGKRAKKSRATSRSSCGVNCGSERWPIKTLSDPESTCVNFTARQTTISWLVSQDAPTRLPDQSRSGTIECQVWQLVGRVEKFKSEDDGDFHIVVEDLEKPELTMIVEIPDPSCSGVCDSPLNAEIVRARESFTQLFGLPPKRFERLKQTVLVTITGVGFFDFMHRQTGLAQNGVELHPVIGFQVANVQSP